MRRQEGRQRLRRLTWGLAAGSVLTGAVGLGASPVFDVDAVRIAGAAHTGEAAVLDAVGVGPGDAMVLVDPRSSADALERLPWVERAQVERDWPGTVVVSVEERQPALAVPSPDGRFTLVDRGGHELAAVDRPGPGLPVLEGLTVEPRPGSVLEEARGALDVVAALPASVAGRVSRLAIRPEGVTLALRAGDVAPEQEEPEEPEAQVVLGQPTDLGAKVQALAALLEAADLTDLRTVDLRVPAAPVLTRGP